MIMQLTTMNKLFIKTAVRSFFIMTSRNQALNQAMRLLKGYLV